MVLGIRGESGAGKSLLASMLCYCFNNVGNEPDLMGYMEFMKEYDAGFIQGKWKVANFASTLKIACSTLYGIDHKLYEKQSFKDESTGITIYTLNIVFNHVDNESEMLIPFRSFETEEQALKVKEEIISEVMDDIEFRITSKELTWRDTLNEASHGLHLYLGPNIALQAYEHRFANANEHLIMCDVRKSKEIDLIKENGGLILWIKRNFVYEVNEDEAVAFFKKTGYIYSLADGNNPIKIEDPEEAEDLLLSDVPFGIDCKPKFNLADSWLDGDDRYNIMFYNPSGNPKNQNCFVQLFEEVKNCYQLILSHLIKQQI